MSADNFIHVRKFPEGYRYAHVSASEHWDATDWESIQLPPESYVDGPFATKDEMETALDSEFSEYGVYGRSRLEGSKPPLDEEAINKWIPDGYLLAADTLEDRVKLLAEGVRVLANHNREYRRLLEDFPCVICSQNYWSADEMISAFNEHFLRG